MANNNENSEDTEIEETTIGSENHDEDYEIKIESDSKAKGFLNSLKNTVDKMKEHGLEIGKTTAKSAGDIGNKIDDAIDDSVNVAKGLGTSKNETLDLLERLAKMKEQGVINEKEFNAKKKDLLDKI